MKYRWINLETGEVYRNLFHALKTIIADILHYESCRTVKMFSISRLEVQI